MTHPGPPVPQRDHQEILAGVGQRCVAELGVDWATIAVATGPQSWMPAYASDPAAAALEQIAFTVGEGPCFDALRDHVPVVVADLDHQRAAEKWPAWTYEAREAEVRSVAAFPIQAGAMTSGVLTVYSGLVGRIDRARFATAQRLADIAFLGLLDIMAGLTADDVGDIDLSTLLRADVHRAAGMIMAQADLTIDQALVRLRAHAFGSGSTITDVAADVLNGRIRFEPDGHSA